MQSSSTSRATVTLRPYTGETLEYLRPFLLVGSTVMVGRAGAVIEAVRFEDALTKVDQMESQLVLADAALARSKAMHAPWTDAQVLDFCSVAFRHVVVEGDLRFGDINDGLRYMADKGKPAFVPQPEQAVQTGLLKTEESTINPRDLFIATNPVGASSDELEKGRSGFVDASTHADYLIFLAGYRAAQCDRP